MYTEDQIRAAACGKSAAQGGLNLPDIKKILTASGLSTSGNGDEVRATLKENLDTCLAQQGRTSSPIPRSATFAAAPHQGVESPGTPKSQADTPPRKDGNSNQSLEFTGFGLNVPELKDMACSLGIKVPGIGW